MADLRLTNFPESNVPTPVSGNTSIFVDSADKTLKVKIDTGFITSLFTNFSIAQQAISAATRTYMTGSKVTVPSNGLQAGTMFRWTFNIAKTAAGTASSVFDICVGTAGTTADTARVSFTKPAGTAIADEGLVTINATVRSIGTGGIMAGTFSMIHNLENTGHLVIPSVVVTTISAAFDMTIPSLFVGVCATTGASDVITIEQLRTECWNL